MSLDCVFAEKKLGKNNNSNGSDDDYDDDDNNKLHYIKRNKTSDTACDDA